MRIRLHHSLSSIARESWNQWLPQRYPFLNYDFLWALETSHCVYGGDLHNVQHDRSGWISYHIELIDEQGNTQGYIPGYLKTHSYGEYVFDWSWADAYQTHQLQYYPKLVTAIPFTPASGPRWLSPEPHNIAGHLSDIWQSEDLQRYHPSGWHWLFYPADDTALPLTCMPSTVERHGCQFHWFNRDYQTFNDFTDTFTSRKRKQLNKERRQVIEQGIEFEWKHGADISDADWQHFAQCYKATYHKRSGHDGYLNEAFFQALGNSPMVSQLSMLIAKHNHQAIAASLFFHDDHTLYGRYWGCLADVRHLHFECCYYQGIELAIAMGLKRFDAGAQGEHKLQRGFEPQLTVSTHIMADSPFLPAIRDFCDKEQQDIQDYLHWAKQQLPFAAR